jgi:phosphopantothenoylcysteine decarboxylase
MKEVALLLSIALAPYLLLRPIIIILIIIIFLSSQNNNQNNKTSKPDHNVQKRVLLCVSGSVAAVKTPEIVNMLLREGCYVDIVFSKAGRFFMDVEYKGETPLNRLAPALLLRDSTGTKYVETWTDEDEWNTYKRVGDDVVHINLAKRNSVLLIAPLDANTLARISLGLCPNLLTCTVRAWGWSLRQESSSSSLRPIVVAPAMNTQMWYQLITQHHLDTIIKRGARVVSPQVKTLACGDHGKGAMANPKDIVRVVLNAMKNTT